MDRDRYQKVKNLCQSVLEIEQEKREVYLREACAGDGSLRNEVEALLAHQKEAEGFLKDAAMEQAAKQLAKEQTDVLAGNLTGRVISYYRIAERIGQGGMGEVYRAKDSRLNRAVAFKALPDEFARDAERLARFQREAQVLASLSHPNIATLYGLEESDGKRFIIMELVEGQTLAHRLLKGPLPVDEALYLCRQIAEGLGAAHEKGVIHRDLKPGNVMITVDDKVKILDFGLAKALASESQAAETTNSPVITEVKTRPGVILGTAAYMSPEQAKGKTVDKRADIWAFGCVLYECLTGKRAFHSETISETVAAILTSEPNWTLLPAGTPAPVRAVLRQCLQKDPARRLHDVADAFIRIEEPSAEPSELAAFQRRPSLWRVVGLVALAAIAATLGVISLIKHFQVAPSLPVTRSILRFEAGQRLEGMTMRTDFLRPSRTAMAVSSDGRFVVYSAIEGNPSPPRVARLYLRRMDQMEAKPISGTEDGVNPFLSPDNRWVGFWAEGKLKKVPIDGGVPVPLCDVEIPFGFSWGPTNNIVFTPNEAAGLFSVSADGGRPQVLTTPDKAREELGHRLPHFLPDGKALLFTIMRESWDTQPSVAVLDLQTRKWRVLMDGAADAHYAPTGHLVFLLRGTLLVVPFDVGKCDVMGRPVPAVVNVMQAINATHQGWNTCAGQFSISNSGMLTYVSGGVVPDGKFSLEWVDPKGTAQPIPSFKAPFISVRLSPEGQRVAYTTIGSELRLHVYDLNRATESPLTVDGKSFFLTWTPDGKRLIFSWLKSGESNLYWQAADGSSPMERLTTSEYSQNPGELTPDGTTLAFEEDHPNENHDILLLDLKSRRVTPYMNSIFDERYPAFSPNGRWLAYSSNESGREEVYVRSYPGSEGRWELSLEGGTEPLWANNGRQLFYRWQNQVWAVDVRTEPDFTPRKPRLLFEKPRYVRSDPVRSWDISHDDRRFLMVNEGESKQQPVTEMILVQNWFEELKRLAPPK